jgi:malate dehydrogenase
MPTVSILGSGNVGANTAFFIAEKGIADVALYDIREGLSTGKSLDLMEAAPLRRYRNVLRGAKRLEEIAGSQIVVLAAGAVRRPGMKREELYGENLRVVEALAPAVARLAPQASLIVATEPVDPITAAALRLSGLPRERVFGIGGCLDATRLRYAVARELSVSTEDVAATVIGRHSDAMIVLPRYCSVSGVSLPQLLAPERIAALVEEVRRAGDLIVGLAQRSSAFYAPSAAAADLVDAVHMDLKRVLCVSVGLEGEYGVGGSAAEPFSGSVAMSLPAVIGARGIERVLTPPLTEEERARFRQSAADLASLARGGQGGGR